jgi:hypothetical protein
VTPSEAQRILRVVEDDPTGNVEDEIELSPLERRYCHEFVFGPHAGIQMRAYQDASGLPDVNSCSWQSSAMMKLTRVTRYIRQLQRELRVQRAATYLEGKKTWHELAQLGMGVIDRGRDLGAPGHREAVGGGGLLNQQGPGITYGERGHRGHESGTDRVGNEGVSESAGDGGGFPEEVESRWA